VRHIIDYVHEIEEKRKKDIRNERKNFNAEELEEQVKDEKRNRHS
jgi:hypothetical protein